MKGFLQEYGLAMVVVAVLLISIGFTGNVLGPNIKNTMIQSTTKTLDDSEWINISYSNGTYGSTPSYNSETKIISVLVNSSTQDSTWGEGVACTRSDPIPFEKWYNVSFEIYSPVDATLCIDINNSGVGGVTWNGNDNDIYSTRFLNNDFGKNTASLKAGQWTKFVFGYQNTNSKNTNKVSLKDWSYINIKYNKSLGNQTYKIRNLQSKISNVKASL